MNFTSTLSALWREIDTLLRYFYDNQVIIANAVGAAIAAGIHIWAASRVRGRIRILFGVIASLALTYSVSYLWLLTHLDMRAEWSQFMSQFGGPTWIIAWSIEPIVLVHYLSDHGRNLETRLQELIAAKGVRE